MNQEYSEYKCIEMLSDANKDRFNAVVAVYGKKLDATVLHDGGTVYTLHDFTHHCCNIYHYISNIILYQEIAFSPNGLTEQELYVLDLAVLLHDIGMQGYVGVRRGIHSRKSAELIEKGYEEELNPLNPNSSGVSHNELTAIKRIVQAHSDVKGKKQDPADNGLDDVWLTNKMVGTRGSTIRALFLANLLRMADELDVTNERLGHLEVMKELQKETDRLESLKRERDAGTDESEKEELQKEISRAEESAESLRFWKRLRLFNNVTRDEADIVWIHVDDAYVGEMIREGESIDVIMDEIEDTYRKIRKEFERFCHDISSDMRICNMVAMKQIHVKTGNDVIGRELEEREKKDKVEPKKSDDVYPHILSGDVAHAISKYVDEKRLYKAGHYTLQPGLCARDWVLAGEMIEDDDMAAKCEEQFMIHMKSLFREGEKCLIIGIDFYGMLIAAKLALMLGLPYTYIVPEDRSRSFVEDEMLFDPADYDRVVLVIDVIVTYKTVRDIVKKCRIENKLSAIYAVFVRDTEDHRFLRENTEWVEKTYALNMEYEIEIHENTKCRYKDCGKCMAANRRYD